MNINLFKIFVKDTEERIAELDQYFEMFKGTPESTKPIWYMSVAEWNTLTEMLDDLKAIFE